MRARKKKKYTHIANDKCVFLNRPELSEIVNEKKNFSFSIGLFFFVCHSG